MLIQVLEKSKVLEKIEEERMDSLIGLSDQKLRDFIDECFLNLYNNIKNMETMEVSDDEAGPGLPF